MTEPTYEELAASLDRLRDAAQGAADAVFLADGECAPWVRKLRAALAESPAQSLAAHDGGVLLKAFNLVWSYDTEGNSTCLAALGVMYSEAVGEDLSLNAIKERARAIREGGGK